MKLLVLAPQAVDATAITAAMPGEDLSQAEVLVVSPALNPSGIRFWMSDSDDAIRQAEEASAETAAALRDQGAQARAATGESEPLLAIQDALAGFPADRIVIFRGDGDAYREEDLAEVRDRFGLPVTEI
jgi:hypothetical protein